MDIVKTGLIDFVRSSSKNSGLIKSEYHDNGKRVIYSSGVDFAPCNGVIEKIAEDDINEQQIDEVVNLFHSKQLPFVWWSNNKILEAKGFQYGGVMKGVTLNIANSALNAPIPPAGLKIKVVETEQELYLFSKLIIECFGVPTQALPQYVSMSNYGMKQKEQMHYLAYMNGVPVSTATLATNQTTAGIWNCGTLPEYRRQGIGTALCFAVLSEAKKRNYHEVMAVLMPSGMAWGVFRNFAFKEVCNLPFYVFGNAPEGSVVSSQ
jgi:hypothetical protein